MRQGALERVPGSDGGVPNSDGGATYDGGHDCSMHTNCRACTNDDGCGFCDGRCVSLGEGASCGEFFSDADECYDCSVYTNCRGCANNAYCGWCGSSCENTARMEAAGGVCGGHIDNPDSC